MAHQQRVLILGAAGRDFHNFNTAYRDRADVRVVAFTATQIPGIDGRIYPPALAGPHYPEGIPIVAEADLEMVCARERVDTVVFAYSDVTNDHVMGLAARALAAGADVTLLGPKQTMLRSTVPVIAVTAVRTGCGKSQVSRWLGRLLHGRGLRVAVLRHPMPYGDLKRQRAQRFGDVADLARAECTVEEREEYEPHLAAGNVVFAGVDYAEILRMAEGEADIVIWDGGNNDYPFIVPDLHVVLADALRPGQIGHYHPGEATLRMADIAVVNKVDAATPEQVDEVLAEVRAVAPGVPVVRAASPVTLDTAGPAVQPGQRALVVEDGPTITHGGMPHGAGYVAALAAGAEIVDPRPHATPEIARVYRQYPHIGAVLPAVGYGPEQLRSLAETVRATPCDVVIAGTPVDLSGLIAVERPVIRAHYAFAEAALPGEPTLRSLIEAFLDTVGESA